MSFFEGLSPFAAAAGCVLPEKHVVLELLNGKVSITAQNLYLPSYCTPSRKRRLMLLPLASGEASVTADEDMLLLNPPPFAWFGGCSSVVPRTVAPWPPLNTTRIVFDVRPIVDLRRRKCR